MKITSKQLISINSLMQALVISTSFLAAFFSLTFEIHSGFISIMLAILLSYIFFEILARNKITLNKQNVFHLIHLLLLCLLTYSMNGVNTGINIFQLFYFCVISYYVALKNNNVEMLLKFIIYIYSLSILSFNKIVESVDLSLAYSMLPGMVAVIIYIKYYKTHATIPLKIAIAINLIMLVNLVLEANRGFVVGIFLTLILTMLYSFKEDGYKSKQSIFQIFKKIFTAIAILFLLLNYEYLILGFYNAFKKIGIELFFLEKFIIYLEAGDVTNGRRDLYQAAYNGIKSRPFFGHGIGVFQYNPTNGTSYYPHNFILQLLYDGGIVLGLPYIFQALKSVLAVTRGMFYQKNKFTYALLLMCSSIPQVTFSSDIWMVPIFWMFIAYVSRSTIELKKELHTQQEMGKAIG